MTMYLLSWELKLHQGRETSARLILGCVSAETSGVVQEEAMDSSLLVSLCGGDLTEIE